MRGRGRWLRSLQLLRGFVVVVVVSQSLSRVQLFMTPRTTARLASLSFTVSPSSDSCPLSQWSYLTGSSSVAFFSFGLRSFPASGFFSALHIRWSKNWSFSISPSKEYLVLISFRTDWFDLLAVQGTLKCLSQHHNSKALVLWSSAFFKVWFSHLYMTTRKIVALTVWTFVSKLISLGFFLNTVKVCDSFLSKEQAS